MKTHRFVLSLENAVCPDYLTEKAFRCKELIVRYRQQAEKVIPSDAFIAIDDFESIGKLKEHLVQLQKNDEEYMKYFAWIDREEDREIKRRGVCELCTDLHFSPRRRHSSLARAAFPDDNLCEKRMDRMTKTVIVVVLVVISGVVLAMRYWLSFRRRAGYQRLSKDED